MGVYIKGMEMPTGCGECRFVQKGSQEFCGLLLPDFKYSENWSIRPDHCPLIELPPHGDLIDRDALNIDISKSVIFTVAKNRPSAEMRGAFKVLDRLENAPTIIEAEEADNEQE